jgi:hypothetical protein
LSLAILGAVTPEELAEMLRRDREEWDALAAVLDARPSGALHDPESPAWDASDVYMLTSRAGSTIPPMPSRPGVTDGG